MYAKADIKYIETSANELSEAVKALKQYEEELESVKRVISSLPDFEACVLNIKAINEEMLDKRYKLSSLAQALRNIAGIYRRVESDIEKIFELSKIEYEGAPLKMNDFAEAEKKTDELLYGNGTKA